MSLSNIVNKAGPFTCNGVTRNWPYLASFDIILTTDIEIWLISPSGALSQITSSYEVDTTLGEVIYPTIASEKYPIAAGYQILLMRVQPLTQLTNLQTQGSFNADTVETMADKLTMITQQLQEQIDRCLKVDLTEGEGDPTALMEELNDAVVAAETAKAAADADVVLTHADVVLTHADVVLTHADVLLTNSLAPKDNPAFTTKITVTGAGTTTGINTELKNSTPATVFSMRDDGILTLPLQSGAEATLTTNQTIAHDTITKVLLETKVYDIQGEFDITTNNRFTAKVAGYYLVCASICWTVTVAAGKIYMTYIYKNNSNYHASYIAPSILISNSTSLSCVVYLAVNDYIELFCWHNAGINAQVLGNTDSARGTFLSVTKIA